MRTRNALAVGAGLASRALTVAQAILLSLVIARVFMEGADLRDISPLLLVLAVVAILKTGALWLSEFFAHSAGSELLRRLYGGLLIKLDFLGPVYLQRQQTGNLVGSVTAGVDAAVEYVAVYQPLRAMALLVPVLTLAVVLLFDPLSALVLLATGPMLILLLALIGSRTREIAERRLRELTWLSAYFLDVLQGLPTLKLFGLSREQIATTARLSRQYGAANLHLLRTAFETTFVLEMSTTVATALVAVETGLRLAHGAMGFETALVVLLITPEFFLPLRQLSANYHVGAAGRAGAERIFEILDAELPPHAQRGGEPVPDKAAHDGIRFESVTARYSDGRLPALAGVSFQVRPGETTALVGASGAGKSTCANLLLGFIDPEWGEVFVDGVRLSTCGKAAWRRNVAWVPQHAHVFAGTITDNIRLGNPPATHEQVVRAATAAGAHEFITAMPHGYDTELQEHGANLSGGQRQRIGFARAYLKDAPILILDEPTAHVDSATEAALLGALQALSKGRTTLLITHRMDLVRQADQVVCLDRGRVVGAGTHAELLAGCAVYRGLVAGRQAGAA